MTFKQRLRRSIELIISIWAVFGLISYSLKIGYLELAWIVISIYLLAFILVLIGIRIR